MKLPPCAALLILLCVPVTALPPGTTIQFAENPNHDFNVPDGSSAAGIVYTDRRLSVAANDALTGANTAGGHGCSIRNSGSVNGDPAGNGQITYLPRKYGAGESASTTVFRYKMNVWPYCVYDGQIPLGAGHVEALTYHRGHFYGLWREGDSNDLYLRKYNPDWKITHSWFLAAYGTTAYTGPQGLSFYGDMMVMPRTSTSTDDFGVEFWQFMANGDPKLVGSTSNPIWYNQAVTRYDIASEGLDIIDDLADGATTPYVWLVGRDVSRDIGIGSIGVARYDLLVTQGSYNWTPPPVAPTGTPQVLVDQDNGDPEGIAVDASNVYLLYANAIEKWTHSGDFVTTRDVSSDFPDIHLGGGAIHNGFLYVETTNAPSLPRASSLLQYDLTNLSLVASRATYDGYGEGGGIGIHNGLLYILKNKDLSGEYYVQRYDPVTLDFVDESRVGYHHEFSLQGAEFIHRGSTVYLYAPHAVPDDPFTTPGIHLWKSETNGATWTYHGAAAYWTWLNPGDANREEAATQDLEFGCLDDVPYAWSVGRDATDGTGAGSWTRHAVSDPDGFLNCINPPTASITISPNVHAANGAAAGTEWTFPASAPGTTNVLSTTYLKSTNSGTASGTIRVHLDNFTRVDGGQIGLANNVVYRYATGASPADVTTWNTVGGGADATGYIPVPEGATTWVQYRLTELPSVLPDGTYAASLSITDES